MSIKGIEFFEELWEIHNEKNKTEDKYRNLLKFLEEVAIEICKVEKLKFSNFFARLNFICDKYQVNEYFRYWLNTFRINANKVRYEGLIPDEICPYISDLKAICDFGCVFYKMPLPEEFIRATIGYQQCRNNVRKPRIDEEYPRLRVQVISIDDNYIYANTQDIALEDVIKISYNVISLNIEFNETVESLWVGCQLNLIDVSRVSDNIFIPKFIILEPDYLIDISSIAELFQGYTDSYLSYFRSRLETIPNKDFILLGNIANNMVDAFIHASNLEDVNYTDVMQKSFNSSPIEFSTCELQHTFNATCENHFINIRNIILNIFPNENIETDMVILEPSFICESLGIQGRLDILSQNYKKIVELKSGQAKTFPALGIKTNHYVQTLLYYALLNSNFSNDDERKTFIMYSLHNQLFHANRLDSLTKKALNKRNFRTPDPIQ